MRRIGLFGDVLIIPISPLMKINRFFDQQFFLSKLAKIYGATFGLSPQKWGSLFRKNSLNLLKSSKIHGVDTFFRSFRTENYSEEQGEVQESPWRPQKWKDHKFLHRNYTQLFFSTPKKKIRARRKIFGNFFRGKMKNLKFWKMLKCCSKF